MNRNLCSCQGATNFITEDVAGYSPFYKKGMKSPLPVAMTVRSHLFPYRTQQLSSPVPKVLGWTRPGRIGRCRFPLKAVSKETAFFRCVWKPWVDLMRSRLFPYRRSNGENYDGRSCRSCSQGKNEKEPRASSRCTCASGGRNQAPFPSKPSANML